MKLWKIWQFLRISASVVPRQPDSRRKYTSGKALKACPSSMCHPFIWSSVLLSDGQPSPRHLAQPLTHRPLPTPGTHCSRTAVCVCDIIPSMAVCFYAPLESTSTCGFQQCMTYKTEVEVSVFVAHPITHHPSFIHPSAHLIHPCTYQPIHPFIHPWLDAPASEKTTSQLWFVFSLLKRQSLIYLTVKIDLKM